MTDTPEPGWLAAVRRCGGKPRPDESQLAFIARVSREFGVDLAPREMPADSKP